MLKKQAVLFIAGTFFVQIFAVGLAQLSIPGNSPKKVVLKEDIEVSREDLSKLENYFVDSSPTGIKENNENNE